MNQNPIQVQEAEGKFDRSFFRMEKSSGIPRDHC